MRPGLKGRGDINNSDKKTTLFAQREILKEDSRHCQSLICNQEPFPSLLRRLFGETRLLSDRDTILGHDLGNDRNALGLCESKYIYININSNANTLVSE